MGSDEIRSIGGGHGSSTSLGTNLKISPLSPFYSVVVFKHCLCFVDEKELILFMIYVAFVSPHFSLLESHVSRTPWIKHRDACGAIPNSTSSV